MTVTGVSPSTWNVAVVVIGTAVGILASIRGLWTTGVGINVPSYFDYPGPTSYFYLPGNYTFQSLKGEVFGIIINATCDNRTAIT